jgi:hypothetical protein
LAALLETFIDHGDWQWSEVKKSHFPRLVTFLYLLFLTSYCIHPTHWRMLTFEPRGTVSGRVASWKWQCSKFRKSKGGGAEGLWGAGGEHRRCLTCASW